MFWAWKWTNQTSRTKITNLKTFFRSKAIRCERGTKDCNKNCEDQWFMIGRNNNKETVSPQTKGVFRTLLAIFSKLNEWIDHVPSLLLESSGYLPATTTSYEIIASFTSFTKSEWVNPGTIYWKGYAVILYFLGSCRTVLLAYTTVQV